jgi:Tfp pilus assembly protein PilX
MPSTCTDDRNGERGWALVTALMLMAMMMASSLIVANYLDTEGNQTRIGRNRETSFNIAEAALNAQVYSLSQAWPGSGAAVDATAKFAACDQTSSSTKCPTNSQLVGMFPTSDASAGVQWSTSVRDNSQAGAPNFYSDQQANTIGYDANGDGTVWVRSSATVRGKTRTLVALVRAEQQYEDIPHATLISGSLSFGNSGSNGNKQFIDNGNSVIGVETRCTPGPSEPAGGCEGVSYGDNKFATAVQTAIQPYVYTPGSTRGPAITADTLARMISTAKLSGNYYTTPSSCSPAPPTAGRVVVYDFPVATAVDCPLPSDTTATNPGMVIILHSKTTMSETGNKSFHGVLYHANLENSSGTLFNFSGTDDIYGGVLIDGPGTFYLQGNAKLHFDDNAFGVVKSVGAAGIVRDTWRELTS